MHPWPGIGEERHREEDHGPKSQEPEMMSEKEVL